MVKTYTFVSFPPVKQQNNNRVLNAPMAMPFKDTNSSGDSNFAAGRSVYMRSLDLSLYNLQSPSNDQTMIWKKKFYGGTNRDASSVSRRNSNYAIGKSSINETGGNITFS
jgi:hypothetical protein